MITLEERVEFLEKYLSQKFKDFDEYKEEDYLMKSPTGRQEHLERKNSKRIDEPKYVHKFVTNAETGAMEYKKVLEED